MAKLSVSKSKVPLSELKTPLAGVKSPRFGLKLMLSNVFSDDCINEQARYLVTPNDSYQSNNRRLQSDGYNPLTESLNSIRVSRGVFMPL